MIVRTIAALLAVGGVDQDEVGRSWPRVQAVTKATVIHNAEQQANGLALNINSVTGAPLYRVRCHGADYEDPDVNYSGMLECKLFSVIAEERFDNLLPPAGSVRSWQGRGRFFVEHLRKGCAADPDWGASRVFRLRGMAVTVQIAPLTKGTLPGRQQRAFNPFRVQVTARPDRNATSENAAPVASPEPAWFARPAPCVAARKRASSG